MLLASFERLFRPRIKRYPRVEALFGPLGKAEAEFAPQLGRDGHHERELSRRNFIKVGGGAVVTAFSALGFGDVEAAYAAAIRSFKLLNTTETRNTCTYCSVACGIVMYAKGDLSKGEKAEITHIEGDVDHPTNRGRVRSILKSESRGPTSSSGSLGMLHWIVSHG